jgi:hypothetical protein
MGTTARWYQFGLRRLLLFTATVAAFLGWLRVEWLRAVTTGDGNAILGPLHLAMDTAPSNVDAGVFLMVLLIPCLFGVLLKPHPVTFVVSLLAFLAWMFLGIVGQGISC